MENYCFTSSLWRKDCFLGGLIALLSCLRLTVWPMPPPFYDTGPAFSDPPLPGCEDFLSSWHSSSVCFSLANKSILLLALQKVRQLAGSLSWSTNCGGCSRAGAGCLCVGWQRPTPGPAGTVQLPSLLFLSAAFHGVLLTLSLDLLAFYLPGRPLPINCESSSSNKLAKNHIEQDLY